MINVTAERAWIFVSHASADIANVRKVRNYLEELDAAPLLFHLLALSEPDEFWPLIEREIMVRNFFLYCDSKAARSSEWVTKELAVVERKPVKRFGTIAVDVDELDLSSLRDFVAMTRVFPSFSRPDRARVLPYLNALQGAGFSVFDDLTSLQPGMNWQLQIQQELDRAASSGWVVAFLSAFSLQRPNILQEIEYAVQLGAKFIPVLLEPLTLPPSLQHINAFLGYTSADGPTELANLLLQRQR